MGRDHCMSKLAGSCHDLPGNNELWKNSNGAVGFHTHPKTIPSAFFIFANSAVSADKKVLTGPSWIKADISLLDSFSCFFQNAVCIFFFFLKFKIDSFCC